MKFNWWCTVFLTLAVAASAADPPERIKYNNPGLPVDLGVGLWAQPFPVDFDDDGDLDLVVLSGGKPDAGVYFFENPGCPMQPCAMPVFKAPVRKRDYQRDAQISLLDDGFRVLTPGREHPNFLKDGFGAGVPLPLRTEDIHTSKGRVRANQWRYLDYENDGDLDLIVGIGDWAEYGWDDAYNERGEWTNGPLHGYVYLVPNQGTTAAPRYGKPRKVEAGGEPIDVFGMPSPNFADYDSDGDLDLICGEFMDGFTFFENTGSRRSPVYAGGRRLPIKMDLQMITPVAVDWDGDGDPDLVVGDEDGRVAFIQNQTDGDGELRFMPPHYFKQQADEVKFGALVTPVSFDWDGDGDEDLICGNTAGYIGFIENLDGGHPPRWAAPVYLKAGGEVIRFQAGENGSIQGPAEAKWGYTTLSVAYWDGDRLPDLVVNSIWGKLVWYRNTGTLKQPRLAAAQPVRINWDGASPKPDWNWWNPAPGEFASQWRTTPYATDWNGDGLTDIIMLDHEGYLALFERKSEDSELVLQPGRRVFIGEGAAVFDGKQKVLEAGDGSLRLNTGRAGKSGRRKFCFADWDGDGKQDLLVNSVSANLLRQVGENRFRDTGPVTDTVLAGHTTSPTTVDWDGDGVRDLLIGAEDGFFYYLPNPRGIKE
jgi:VCBS repeat protein